MNMEDMILRAHQTSKDKGWWEGVDDPSKEIPAKLMLMVSELAEALEEYRNGNMSTYYQDSGKPEGFDIELADCVIRIFDLCGALGIDLEEAIHIKSAYNSTRPHRHGGKKV